MPTKEETINNQKSLEKMREEYMKKMIEEFGDELFEDI
jgi:hypothetical protein